MFSSELLRMELTFCPFLLFLAWSSSPRLFISMNGIVLTKASFGRQSHQRLRWQTHRVPHVTKVRADLEAVRHPDNLECSRRLALPPWVLAPDHCPCPVDSGSKGHWEPSKGPLTCCSSSRGTLPVRTINSVKSPVKSNLSSLGHINDSINTLTVTNYV